MSEKGYIKIDRKIDGWEYRHDMSRLGFWLHLLLSAEWKGPERGVFVTSRREIERETSLDHKTISKYLTELEQLQQIQILPAGRMSKIIILNYEQYQGILPRAKSRANAGEIPQSEDLPRAKSRANAGEIPQSEDLPRAKSRANAGEIPQSESTPSLFNRNNEEIECIKNRNTYTGESVDAELLTDAEKWFSEFWTVYPKHKAKAAAEKAFRKVCTSADEFRRIMAGLNNAISRDWQNIDPRYIPYPATWINGKRWEDEETSQKTRNPYIQALINEMNGEKNEPEGNENDSGYDPFDVSHYRKQWADG